jgi:hypothetical protein
MEIIKIEHVASVTLAEVKVSEDELTVYATALDHILNTLNGKEIEERFGSTVDELEAMHDDIIEILERHSRNETEQQPKIA